MIQFEREEDGSWSTRRAGLPGGTFILVLTCLLSAAIAGSASAGAPETTGRTGPNIVLIMADDLGYGDLGCYGHPRIRTPNLDRLAAEGVRLTAQYAPAPLCSPTRAAVLTGRTPYRVGFHDILDRNLLEVKSLPEDTVTMADRAKTAGYATAIVGKWHVGGRPGEHGFDHWMVTSQNAEPSHRNPENFVRNGKPVGKTEGYSAHVVVEEAMRWMGTLDDEKPFLLLVWLHEPHEPVASAPRFERQYEDVHPEPKREYFANVTQIDAAVGRLIDHLDRRGESKNTFVHFTSDNGPEYRAEHSYGSSGPLRGHKLDVYEGGIRVPGIARYPGVIPAGTETDTPVNGTDLLPTVCRLMGVDPPGDRVIDGVDVMPVLKGEVKRLDRPRPLYWRERRFGDYTMRRGDWKLYANSDGEEYELYNLRRDVGEQKDLSGKKTKRVESMRNRLNALNTRLDRIARRNVKRMTKKPLVKPEYRDGEAQE